MLYGPGMASGVAWTDTVIGSEEMETVSGTALAFTPRGKDEVLSGSCQFCMAQLFFSPSSAAVPKLLYRSS